MAHFNVSDFFLASEKHLESHQSEYYCRIYQYLLKQQENRWLLTCRNSIATAMHVALKY